MRFGDGVLAVSLALLIAVAAPLASAQPTSSSADLAPSESAAAPMLGVELTRAVAGPASPKMGDRLAYHSTIRDMGTKPVAGIVAWLSLVQVDPSMEQPVDLEDWSAHKAITIASLAPGEPCKRTGRCG